MSKKEKKDIREVEREAPKGCAGCEHLFLDTESKHGNCTHPVVVAKYGSAVELEAVNRRLKSCPK